MKTRNTWFLLRAQEDFKIVTIMIIKLRTEPNKFYNITYEVKEKVCIKDGICIVFCPGSTGAIIINEDDAMLLEDLKKKLSEIAPENEIYQHPDNAHSHIRACLLGSSKTIPVKNGELVLGTWQDILFYECDTKPRDREIIVKFIKS